MKRPFKYWPYLPPLILSAILSAGYLTRAQEEGKEQGRESQAQGLAEYAQSSVDAEGQTKGTRGGSVRSVVVNFVELARRESLRGVPLSEPKAIREPGPGPLPRYISKSAPPTTNEPEAMSASPDAPQVASPAPASSFKALEDNGTSVPPDTHGAVGPYHLMVAHNTQLRIQTKTGGNLSTVTLNEFWSGLGATITFDPRVLYDPYQKRWVITAAADYDSPAASVLVGVSQTSDPTGSWKLYKVDADPSNTLWADYPCIGFNKNWIVVTVNMFTNVRRSFKRTNIYAFDKANLYAFGASANHTLFEDTTNGFTMVPATTYDNTLSTLYMVEEWDGSSTLRISKLTGTASAPAYSTIHNFATTHDIWGFRPFDDGDFLPQLGSNKLIQANDSRMQAVVYRGGSLWCAQTIFLTSETRSRSAVQWWQFSPTGTIQQRGRIDDETGQTFYAYPSIAVNKNKDVLVGFSRFSWQQYASANYAFRAATDPPNTLREDVVLKEGSAPYYKTLTGSLNRWGDYSSTVVDPSNDLDMWTIQEYAAPVSRGTSRWGTWWGHIALGPSPPAPDVQLGTLTARDTGGDADVVIEPGEGATLNVELRNTGSAAATAVTGTLTTATPGVTITADTSAYPDLAAASGAGMNATPFAFKLASTMRCGRLLSFTLTVTYTGGGSPRRLTFTIPTGNRGTTPVEKTRSGTPVKIGEPATSTNPPVRTYVRFAVSGVTGNISDLNFKFGGTQCTAAAGATTVGLDHTRVGDLSIRLTSPQGTVVNLMSRPGGINNPGHNFCNTVLDDDTTRPSIQSISPTGAGAPYSNTYKPANPLSIFDGENPNGTWTLTVTDSVYGETGYVRTFSLIITPSECSTATALAAPVEIRSDRARASLIADEPTFTMSFTQQSSPTARPYLTALFASMEARPVPIEGQLLRSAWMLNQYDDLLYLLAR
jgi:subtilisin-like proprotein convertase family protein